MSDAAVLEEIGRRLARRRLDRDLTQADLAREAGVGKRTVERVEAGESAQLSTLIRIMRVLGLMEALDAAIPPSAPRPMDLLKLKGKERQRASGAGSRPEGEPPWSWGEEK
jgi:transcriptional regulator with XRE-family HTH domain